MIGSVICLVAVRQSILIRTLAISAAKWLISIAILATPAAKRSILTK